MLYNLFQSLKWFKLWDIKTIAQEVFEELLRYMNIIFLSCRLAILFDDKQ